jgi:hypothetical protein
VARLRRELGAAAQEPDAAIVAALVAGAPDQTLEIGE